MTYFGYRHLTLEETPRCFNVGKGQKARPYSKRNRSHKWHAIVKRLGLSVEVCFGPATNEEVCAWEIENIELMGTFSTNHSHNDDIDIGCNFTRGGDGTSGFKHSDKAKQKMRISHLGKFKSEDTKHKISRSHKGKRKSSEHCERLRIANLGKNVGKMAGEKHHLTNLSDEVVICIRQKWLTMSVSRKQLRIEFDLKPWVLNPLLSGATFGHLLNENERKQLSRLRRWR